MKQKKTLSDRLSTPYTLVIRKEENLEEKTTMSFTYRKLLMLSVIVFVIIFTGSLFLSQTLLARWFDPRYAQRETNKKLVQLAVKFDSLRKAQENSEAFIMNMKRVFSGDTAGMTMNPSEVANKQSKPVKPISNMQLAPTDSQFRKEFEQTELSLALTNGKYRELGEIFFFSPITGFITDHSDAKKGHFGTDIGSKSNEPVKAIADGTVIFASWTQDAGYVMAIQHRGNLISVYKHNAELMKKTGSFVNAGEIISIVGNSGEVTNGPHLHFELWYNGSSLNPEEFVTF